MGMSKLGTGELVWNEKKALGKGAIAYADNRFICQGEGDGKIILIEASPNGWKAHGEFVLAPQTQKRNPKGRIWTHPVVSNGKLFLRDQEYILYAIILKNKFKNHSRPSTFFPSADIILGFQGGSQTISTETSFTFARALIRVLASSAITGPIPHP